MADLKRLQAAVEAGDRDVAVEITEQAIGEDIPPLDVLEPMTDAMGVVGDRFSRQEIFVPEMLISARAMKGALALLEPLLIGAGHKPDRVAVMGTIKGDLHDIGKNLVSMMLKGANFAIIDLGTNTSVEAFLEAAREHDADVIGCSALLTTTMGNMRGVVEAVRAADDLPDLRIMVGGAPVTQEFALDIGADGWAPDAASAVDVAVAVIDTARGKTQLSGLIHPDAVAAVA
jgi:5-methyltetrahydrofolate--homocysteine methyltransferase